MGSAACQHGGMNGIKQIAMTLVMSVAVGCSGEAGGGGGPGGDPNADGDPNGPGPVFTDAHPRIYMPRNKDRLTAALVSKNKEAARFIKMVDGQLAGDDVYDFKAWYAALAGQVTGNTKYCAAAVKQVEAMVAAEEVLIASGERPEVSRDSYLYVGDMVGDVALTYDWCNDTVTADQKKRWLDFADKAVWNVWHHDRAEWGGKLQEWSGWSVDNPSNNYYYSFLRATMLLGLASRGEIGSGEEWIKMFRDTKIAGELIPQFASDLTGGGSREGTGYGVSLKELFSLYDFWQGSTGEDLAAKTTHARDSMKTFLHQIVPTLDRVAPTGDHARDSTAALYDYHRHYLQQLIRRYQKNVVAGPAQTLLAESTVPEMTSRFMYVHDFLNAVPEVVGTPMDSLKTAHYASGIGQLYVRSAWDKAATWVNFTAGPYTEVHAHQDQGAFLLYKDGWQAYDPNVDSKSGIQQGTNVHNIVRVTEDGAEVAQQMGTVSKMTAIHRGEGWTHAAADLTEVYRGERPKTAVQKMQREIVFIEPNCLVVFDRVNTAANTQQIWQLNLPASPTLSGELATITSGGHELTAQRLLPDNATTSVYSHTSDSDFIGGFRLDATAAGGNNQFMHVLWLDGDVGSATLSDASGKRGVALSFADGRSAMVRFGATDVGGSIELKRGGSVVSAATLGVGLDDLQ
jgi:hypothetical protein